MDNINNYINVDFYHLSNTTNQRFVAITVLELQAKTSQSTRIKLENLNAYNPMYFFWIMRKFFHLFYDVDKKIFIKLPSEAWNVPLVLHKIKIHKFVRCTILIV